MDRNTSAPLGRRVPPRPDANSIGGELIYLRSVINPKWVCSYCGAAAPPTLVLTGSAASSGLQEPGGQRQQRCSLQTLSIPVSRQFIKVNKRLLVSAPDLFQKQISCV